MDGVEDKRACARATSTDWPATFAICVEVDKEPLPVDTVDALGRALVGERRADAHGDTDLLATGSLHKTLPLKAHVLYSDGRLPASTTG